MLMNKTRITNKLRLLAIAGVASVLLAACADTPGPQQAQAPDTTPGVEDAEGPFIPGVHTATSRGAWGYVVVTLGASEHEILDVYIHHNELIDLEEISQAILAAQDVIPITIFDDGSPSTGAAIEAATQAFSQAMGAPEAIVNRFVPGTYVGFMREYKGGYGEGETRVIMEFDHDNILSVEIDTHMETGEEPTAEDNAFWEAAAIDVQSAAIPELEHLPLTSTNVALAIDWTIRIAENDFNHVVLDEPQAQAGEHALEDGTRFVTVEGRNDALSVGINVEEGAIRRVGIIHRDTPGIVDDAIVGLAQAVLSYQRPDIDIFTGATNTSVAVLEALNLLFESPEAILE